MSYDPRAFTQEDTDDDDDDTFLLARDDASRADLHQLEPMERFDDDEDFLQPHSVSLLPGGGGTSSAAASSVSRAPTATGTGLILGELEREVQYWRLRAETLEADLTARNAAHRSWCAELLQALASAWRPPCDEEHRVVAAPTSSVDPASLHVNAFLALAAARCPAAARTDKAVLPPSDIPSTPEGIVRSDVDDNDDDPAPLGAYNAPRRSAARALRRMRGTPRSTVSNDGSTTVVHSQTERALGTQGGGGRATDVASVLVMQRLREQLHSARHGWAMHAVVSLARARQRFVFSGWREWTAQRRAVRAQVAATPSYRHTIVRAAAATLWNQHVKEGLLRRAWHRWGFMLICRRQINQVQRQVTQYATHGALLGQLIRNHDALWCDLVADVATLLDQQVADLATLKDCATDIVGVRRAPLLL